jgi:hypothetical protein
MAYISSGPSARYRRAALRRAIIVRHMSRQSRSHGGRGALIDLGAVVVAASAQICARAAVLPDGVADHPVPRAWRGHRHSGRRVPAGGAAWLKELPRRDLRDSLPAQSLPCISGTSGRAGWALATGVAEIRLLCLESLPPDVHRRPLTPDDTIDALIGSFDER